MCCKHCLSEHTTRWRCARTCQCCPLFFRSTRRCRWPPRCCNLARLLLFQAGKFAANLMRTGASTRSASTCMPAASAMVLIRWSPVRSIVGILTHIWSQRRPRREPQLQVPPLPYGDSRDRLTASLSEGPTGLFRACKL